MASPADRVLPPDHCQAGRRFPRVGEKVVAYGLEEDDEHGWHPYEVVRLTDDGDPVADCHGSHVPLEPLDWRWPSPGEDRMAVEKFAVRLGPRSTPRTVHLDAVSAVVEDPRLELEISLEVAQALRNQLTGLLNSHNGRREQRQPRLTGGQRSDHVRVHVSSRRQ